MYLLTIVSLVFASCSDSDDDKVNPVLSKDAKVLSFKLTSEFVIGEPQINDKDATIEVTISKQAKDADLKQVPVAIEVSPKAKVLDPVKTLDLTAKENLIRVQAEEATIVVAYKVLVNRETGSSDAELLKIEFSNKDFASPAVYSETDKEWTLNFSYLPTDKDTKAIVEALRKGTKVELAVSEGATVLTNLDEVDVTKPFVIKVQAEDETVKEHAIAVKSLFASNFDFNKWTTAGPAKLTYDAVDPLSFWASSNNKTVNFSRSITNWKSVFKGTESKNGTVSAEITTIETRNMALQQQSNAIVTMGLLYTGQFDGLASDKLACYKYGVPFATKPLKVKGLYKYQSGAVFLESNDALGKTVIGVRDAEDKPSIRVVLYEVGKYEDVEFATARTVKTYDKVIASAYLEGENQADFKDFELNLEYVEGKKYDPSLNYRLALIFSSSYKGDKFSGAPGSKLWIDNVTVISE